MSTDFSIKPVGAPVVTTFLPGASSAPSGSVATQLPPSQSITATNASTVSRNDSQDLGAVSHQAFFDRDAASFVFEAVSTTTGQVVQQFPDDATLRRRAYFHSLDLAKENSARPIVTDVKA
jgi:hypothetical protein